MQYKIGLGKRNINNHTEDKLGLQKFKIHIEIENWAYRNLKYTLRLKYKWNL